MCIRDRTTIDSPTLYVKYLTTATQTASATGSTGASIANSTVEFVNGESLAADKQISSINSGNNSSTLLTSGATSIGSSAAIEEGVYFVRGQFVRVPAQRIVLDKYTNQPSYRVGGYVDVARSLQFDFMWHYLNFLIFCFRKRDAFRNFSRNGLS